MEYNLIIDCVKMWLVSIHITNCRRLISDSVYMFVTLSRVNVKLFHHGYSQVLPITLI